MKDTGKKLIIAGEKCEKCWYGTLWDDGKACKVYCEARGKEYFYGQKVPCEQFKEWKKEEEK